MKILNNRVLAVDNELKKFQVDWMKAEIITELWKLKIKRAQKLAVFLHFKSSSVYVQHFFLPTNKLDKILKASISSNNYAYYSPSTETQANVFTIIVFTYTLKYCVHVRYIKMESETPSIDQKAKTLWNWVNF